MAIEITGRDLLRLGWHKIYSTSFEQYEKEIRDQLQGMLGQYGFNHESDIRATRLVEPSLGGSPLPIPIHRLAPIWMQLLTPASGQLKNRQISKGVIMNALLIEETEENFSGEAVPPPKIAEAGNPTTKTWTAEPGILKIKGYPVDEVFTVLSDQIDVTNLDGSVVRVGPGQSCLLRKGWTGLFHTVEQTRKCFVTAGD
jgi:uncharacterized cupin superfamily protein